MDNILEFLKGFNFQTIISMVVILWVFSKDIKSSIENLDRDVRAMNTRIGRLEGTVYGKDIYKRLDEEK